MLAAILLPLLRPLLPPCPFFSAGAPCFQAATAVNSRQSVRDLLEVGHNYARYGRLIGKTPAVPLLHRCPRYCAFTLAASRIPAF